MISPIHNKATHALSVIEKMSLEVNIKRSELETSLSELTLVVRSLKILRELNKSPDLERFVHKLMIPLSVVYNLLQDMLNEVSMEQVDIDDARIAGQKIRLLLETSYLSADDKSATLARETTSQTLTARSLANIR